MAGYSSINEAFLERVPFPLVSDLFTFLASQPGYADEDTPWVAQYEAFGGTHAPPGALTLRQHDLCHFLLGCNFVSYDDGQRKDSERFLSGFQFGVCPDFTDHHAEAFMHAVEETAPEDYKFGDRGRALFLLGVELGRQWHAARRPAQPVRDFLQVAIDEDHALHRLHFLFWQPFSMDPDYDIAGNLAKNWQRTCALREIQTAVVEQLSQIRNGVRESELPYVPRGLGRTEGITLLIHTVRDGHVIMGGPLPRL